MKPEYIPPDDKAIVAKDRDAVPGTIPILPLNDQVAFPTLNMSLGVKLSASNLIEDAMKGDRIIGIVGIKEGGEETPLPGQVYETGTAVRILYVTRAPDNTVLLVVHGLKRFRITEWLTGTDYLQAKIQLTPEIEEDDIEVAALHRSLRDLTQDIFSLSLAVPDEAIEGLKQIKNSLHLAYIASAYTEIEFTKRQSLLEENSLKTKMGELIQLLSQEKEVLSLGKKIQAEARQEMSKSQRDYFLRQQLKAIKKELGETDENRSEPEDYRERIEESDMSEEARKEALRELQRLEEMSPQSAEYSMVKTYLDWLLDLPWNETSAAQSDIQKARKILNKDHYGLKDVKDRIIEYLAVMNLLSIRGGNGAADNTGAGSASAGVILCFAGPPGVGKTSLGQSIARAMGREFTRMSL
ncbi:MAG: LON peptidase substrate-binding domain-containing protein, partial [Desulfobacterales bacterium]|nr:LON peptidase substrate-binding domain-containing protein [Desulfobacterales bacterium]